MLINLVYVNVMSWSCRHYFLCWSWPQFVVVTFTFFLPFLWWAGKWWRVGAIHQCRDGIAGECRLSIALFEAHTHASVIAFI